MRRFSRCLTGCFLVVGACLLGGCDSNTNDPELAAGKGGGAGGPKDMKSWYEQQQNASKKGGTAKPAAPDASKAAMPETKS